MADVWDAGMATLGWGAALLLVAFRMIGGSGQDDQTVVEGFRLRWNARRREEVLRPAVVCGRNGSIAIRLLGSFFETAAQPS